MSRLIFTCVKNEGPFLLEWLTWHRHLGFDQFLIFSNDCEDGTDAMLDRLAEMGLVHHVRNDNFGKNGPQWTALKSDELAHALARADWAYHTDVDEFLNPRAGDLDGLIDHAGPCDAISLPWRFFGNSNVSTFTDQPVVTQFTACGPYPSMFPRQGLMCKTLFRPGPWLARPGIHAPKVKGQAHLVWRNGNGTPMARGFSDSTPLLHGANAGNDLGQINHYALRSRDSFLVKSDRGLPNRSSVAIDLNYWVLRNFNSHSDPALGERWAACTGALDDLKSGPPLRDLHKAACAWHTAKAEAVRNTPTGAELYAATIVAGDSRVVSDVQTQRIYAAMGAAYKKADP